MRLTLILNPATDRQFAAFAQQQVDEGALSVDELEGRLRVRYPRAAVHARVLSGELSTIWYVYRDGHWVDPVRGR